jgi:serine protease
VTSAAEEKGRERDARDFIIVRLGEPIPVGNDLRRIAKQFSFRGLERFLRANPQIQTARTVQSVGPKRLLRLEERARQTEFAPLHSLTSYWQLDCRAVRDRIPSFVKTLNSLPEVDLAYRVLRPSDPGTVVNPGSNPMYSGGKQLYLSNGHNGNPAGINAVAAWPQTDGAGIGFADVELAWCAGHEDLFPTASPATACGPPPFPGATVIFGDYAPDCWSDSRHHGTGVLGIVVGKHNGLGGIGVAPGAGPVLLASRFVHVPDPNQPLDPCTGQSMWIADAITKAAVTLSRGDVLLVEVSRTAPVSLGGTADAPTEVDQNDFTAIRLASALGVIVVEAAGNGGVDLSKLTTPIVLAGPRSGAILVGSSMGAAAPSVPLASSNFGDRVDCYAWGAGVATAGNEADQSTTLDVQKYTPDFTGTSAAAAIIAGAALLVQGAHAANSPGQRLTPAAMRALLSDKNLGTPCAPPPANNIGSMPDLGLVLAQIGLLPDLFIRDNVGDNGSVPSGGVISISPDVVISPTQVSASSAFAAGGTAVTPGQDNFVYVRVSNRNAQPAPGAEVRVYWSEPATLITPLSWTPVNNAPATVNAPPSSSAFASTITWNSADLPGAPGHYCFIASVSHPKDPEPLSAPFGPGDFTWANFMEYIRRNNNVTWRNFDVLDVPGPGGMEAEFLVAGAPDKTRVFDLLITLDRPSAVGIRWEVPLTLLKAFGESPFDDVEIDDKRRRATVFLPARKRISLPKVALTKSARHRCRFLISPGQALETRPATLAIGQFFDRTEVGRITWELRAG